MNAGNCDVFVAKFTAGGVYLWSKRLGGVASEGATSIAVDASDNIFVGGYFSSTTDLGGGALISAGGVDMFVAKYSATGTYQWAKAYGSSGNDSLYSLAVDKRSGDVIITGSFSGSAINFGGATLVQGQTFLARFSGTDGSHIWSKNFGSLSTSQGNSVAIDTNGDIVLVGQFDGAIDLTSNVLSWPYSPSALIATTDSSGFSSMDLFIAKFSSAGACVWSKSFGGPYRDTATGVALDSSGNLFVLGYFISSIDLGGGTMRTPSSNDDDVFLAKFSSAGTPLWSTSFSGPGNEMPSGLAVDSNGNVTVTGGFNYTINIGGDVLTSATSGSSDVFVAKYSPSGSRLWSNRFGGPSNDSSDALAVDRSGSAIVTGTFSGNSNFGNQSLTSAGAGDIFLLRLNP